MHNTKNKPCMSISNNIVEHYRVVLISFPEEKAQCKGDAEGQL